jgi:transcription elongation factor Elf1
VAGLFTNLNKMKNVKAEQVISYVCNCPHCDETIYSEYKDDWDIANNQEYTVEIKCDECGNSFEVDLP